MYCVYIYTVYIYLTENVSSQLKLHSNVLSILIYGSTYNGMKYIKGIYFPHRQQSKVGIDPRPRTNNICCQHVSNSMLLPRLFSWVLPDLIFGSDVKYLVGKILFVKPPKKKRKRLLYVATVRLLSFYVPY